MVWGPRGGGLPSADYLASFDQCIDSLVAVVVSNPAAGSGCHVGCENKRETVKDCDRHSNTCEQPFFAKTCVQEG